MKIVISSPSAEWNTTLACEIQALLESLKLGVDNRDPNIRAHTEEKHSAVLEVLRSSRSVLTNVVVETKVGTS